MTATLPQFGTVWVAVLDRQRADFGPTSATEQAMAEAANHAPPASG